jgi:2'-5' RNA ligase
MRMFVAVEVNDDHILQKIKSMQESFPFKAKPVRLDQIHFTLQFLGEISENKTEDVKKALGTVSFSKFDLTIIGSGAFPNTRNPKVVWLGVDKDGKERMSRLANDVNEILGAIDLKNEKPFKPHLTVFRIKNRIGDITEELLKSKDTKFGTQLVSQIVLKKSDLSPNGPEYTNLGTVSGT